MASKPKAKELVDMDSFGGSVADALPGSFGGSRAGRSTAMAKSLGREPSFFVENPQTADWLSTLAGGLAGAGAGAVYGHQTGQDAGGAATSTAVGAVGGVLAGQLLAYLLRRSAMKRTNTEFDAAKKIKPVPADTPGFMRGLLTPLSGAHHMGEAKAVEALRGNTSAEQAAGGEGIKNTVRTVAPFIPFGGLANVGLGYYDNIKSNDPLDAEKAARQGRPLK